MNDIKHIAKSQEIIKCLNTKTKFNIKRNVKALGITRQSFYNRIKEMKETKIITNFTININPNIRPNNLKYVMLEIKTNPKEPILVEELLKIPQLRMLDGIFGEFSLVALFILKSPEEYYQILNTIDKIMATSYFKKYQIIEIIKVFKTNGISLGSLKYSFKIGERLNLKQIAQNNPNTEYNPEKFPGLFLRIENLRATILIFSTGEIILNGLNRASDSQLLIKELIDIIRKMGIKIYEKKVHQKLFVDDIDYLILKVLQDYQGLKPISTYEIKEIFKIQHQMEISQSTIHNRIKKLERQGVILNYSINFNPKKIGFKGKYLLRIKPKDPSKYNELALRLDMNKNITDLFRIGEQYGLFAFVRVKKIEDFANFIRDLYSSEEIEDTFTNFVLDELKPYTNFIIF